MAKKFPNQAILTGEPVQVHENNYFKDFEIEDVRKRYVRFSVLMEIVNDVLGLPNHATVEQFANRIRDLVYAQNVPGTTDAATIQDLRNAEKDV